MALTITITGNELHDFLKIDGENITLMIDTAKAEAEQFLNTDFEQLEAPAPVKQWIFNRVGQLYENRGVYTAPDYALIAQWRVYPFRG